MIAFVWPTRDLVFAAATVVAVVGTVSVIYALCWLLDVDDLPEVHEIAGEAVTFPRRTWRVVDPPPYDWAVHGDGHEVIQPTGGQLDEWGVRP